MRKDERQLIEDAKRAAIEVLIHNARGPYRGLPRTAGWGYPEPYTRDLMICLLGVLVSENPKLIAAYEKTLKTLAKNQSPNGHIPSLVHDPEDRGASDCTPLFLMGAGLYRMATQDTGFLSEAIEKAILWMRFRAYPTHLPILNPCAKCRENKRSKPFWNELVRWNRLSIS